MRRHYRHSSRRGPALAARWYGPVPCLVEQLVLLAVVVLVASSAAGSWDAGDVEAATSSRFETAQVAPDDAAARCHPVLRDGGAPDDEGLGDSPEEEGTSPGPDPAYAPAVRHGPASPRAVRPPGWRDGFGDLDPALLPSWPAAHATPPANCLALDSSVQFLC